MNCPNFLFKTEIWGKEILFQFRVLHHLGHMSVASLLCIPFGRVKGLTLVSN